MTDSDQKKTEKAEIKPFTFSIATPTGEPSFSLNAGTSLTFVGANGSGKTRLAVKIENDLKLKAHRISAQRALNLNPSIAKISEENAINGLRTGYSNKGAEAAHRVGHRWNGKSITYLLNDFDFLLQSLFADQINITQITHKNLRAGDAGKPKETKFEKLKSIWERLLPKQTLEITGDDIKVLPVGATNFFSATEMSDGERAIFYLIGQTLCAEDNSVLILDEPELHIHKAIMENLSDELEGSRSDCAFIYITHDLEFAASRVGQKFVIQKYTHPDAWTIEEVPNETGFSEEITTKILGSRRPILFVVDSGRS